MVHEERLDDRAGDMALSNPTGTQKMSFCAYMVRMLLWDLLFALLELSHGLV